MSLIDCKIELVGTNVQNSIFKTLFAVKFCEISVISTYINMKCNVSNCKVICNVVFVKYSCLILIGGTLYSHNLLE